MSANERFEQYMEGQHTSPKPGSDSPSCRSSLEITFDGDFVVEKLVHGRLIGDRTENLRGLFLDAENYVHRGPARDFRDEMRQRRENGPPWTLIRLPMAAAPGGFIGPSIWNRTSNMSSEVPTRSTLIANPRYSVRRFIAISQG